MPREWCTSSLAHLPLIPGGLQAAGYCLPPPPHQKMTLSPKKATESLVGPLSSHCSPVSSRYFLLLCLVCEESPAPAQCLAHLGNQSMLLGLRNKPPLTVRARNGLGSFLWLCELRRVTFPL